MRTYNYNTYSDELYHYGVKGMKWRRVKRNKSDLNNLAELSKRYYSEVNAYNRAIDSGKPVTSKQKLDVARKQRDVQNKIDQLLKKYASVTVDRGFEPDGYTIKWVEARIGELDAMGRISKIDFVRLPMNK